MILGGELMVTVKIRALYSENSIFYNVVAKL